MLTIIEKHKENETNTNLLDHSSNSSTASSLNEDYSSDETDLIETDYEMDYDNDENDNSNNEEKQTTSDLSRSSSTIAINNFDIKYSNQEQQQEQQQQQQQQQNHLPEEKFAKPRKSPYLFNNCLGIIKQSCVGFFRCFQHSAAPATKTAPAISGSSNNDKSIVEKKQGPPIAESHDENIVNSLIFSVKPDESSDKETKETNLGVTTTIVTNTTINKTRTEENINETFLLGPQLETHIDKKTLVLDLDETLVHSSFEKVPADSIIPITIAGRTHLVYVAKRPGVHEFIREVCQYFEVVIFTASLSTYADPVIDDIDPEGLIKYRLFRESCTCQRGSYVKELSRLGRALEATVIIDNSPFSYSRNPQSALPISSWFSDKSDTALYDLLPFLKELAMADSVFPHLEKFKELQKHHDEIANHKITTLFSKEKRTPNSNAKKNNFLSTALPQFPPLKIFEKTQSEATVEQNSGNSS